MQFMNQWDIEDAGNRVYGLENLSHAANTLHNLMRWANDNSDGWAYWPKPARSAAKLMTLVSSIDRFDPQDVTDAQLKAALSPVKAFLTRQGVDHSEVIA